MKSYRSILGGGIARELLKQLVGKPVSHVARHDSNGAQLQFTLRKAYRTERGTWDNFTYNSKHVATGGMLLKCFSASQYSWQQPFRRQYRLKPKQVEKADYYIGITITRWAREWGNERRRQYYVDCLDKKAESLTKDAAFMAWVEDREKKVGVSDYSTLTEDQAIEWSIAIDGWKKENQVATT